MPPKQKGASNFKQKNKPFKGKSKTKNEHKIEKVAKKIKKPEKILNKTDRKNKIEQIRENKDIIEKNEFDEKLSKNNILNEETKLLLKNYIKSIKAPKIVALIPFNNSANAFDIKETIQTFLKIENSTEQKSQSEYDFPYLKFQSDPNKYSELNKENYIFIACNRDLETCLDYAKVADIICPILSCKESSLEGLSLDPHTNAKAFDESGYKLLSCLRSQGLPRMMGIIQDYESIPENKKNKIKKLFGRFFSSELGNEEKFMVFERNEASARQLIRILQGVPLKKMEWREKRAYMLVEKIAINNQLQNTVEMTGFLKGNHINSNQLVHLTGYGDYQISRIEILKDPYNTREDKKDFIEKNDPIILYQNSQPELIESLETLCQDKDNKIKETIISKKNQEIEEEEEELKEEEEKINNQENKIEEEKEEELDKNFDNQSDISMSDDDQMQGEQMEEEKKKLKFELKTRSKDELEFEDEVDYAADVSVKDRFKKYKGLKNLRTSDWKKYEDLPDVYSKILIFDDFNKTMKNGVLDAKLNAFAYNGFYVKIYISNIDINVLHNHDHNKPLIMSSLLKYERKITQLHFQVKKWVEASDLEIKSKENLYFHSGFKKFSCNPIFSRIYANSINAKYDKIFRNEINYYASIYGQCMYLPANVLIFKNINNNLTLVGTGDLRKNDPFQVILKRAVLTGYTSKIHKRKAVIKMMFFNPKDIKYFMPVELNTKHGLKGHILESLGTHGLMKCGFSGFIKGNDTICLSLYKRVFPVEK